MLQQAHIKVSARGGRPTHMQRQRHCAHRHCPRDGHGQTETSSDGSRVDVMRVEDEGPQPPPFAAASSERALQALELVLLSPHKVCLLVRASIPVALGVAVALGRLRAVRLGHRVSGGAE
jgi:hypothetical protein